MSRLKPFAMASAIIWFGISTTLVLLLTELWEPPGKFVMSSENTANIFGTEILIVQSTTAMFLVAQGIGAPFMIVWSDLIGRLMSKILERVPDQQNRGNTRVVPAITGVIDRALVTVVAIILLSPHASSGGPSILAILVLGYLGIKSFRGDLGEIGAERKSSLHSMWNSSISIGFAITAGFVFWRIPLV